MYAEKEGDELQFYSTDNGSLTVLETVRTHTHTHTHTNTRFLATVHALSSLPSTPPPFLCCIVYYQHTDMYCALNQDFTKGMDKSIMDILTRFHSIPVFLSQVTQDLFDKQTRF
jgi:hypothetical protein